MRLRGYLGKRAIVAAEGAQSLSLRLLILQITSILPVPSTTMNCEHCLSEVWKLLGSKPKTERQRTGEELPPISAVLTARISILVAADKLTY